MLKAYRQHVAERAEQGIDPLPLTAEQVNDLVELIKAPPAGEGAFLLDLITNRTPAGVDDAAYVKAAFLTALAKGEVTSPIIDRNHATQLLGTMLGGYNIEPLIALLDDEEVAQTAMEGLSGTLLMFGAGGFLSGVGTAMLGGPGLSWTWLAGPAIFIATVKVSDWFRGADPESKSTSASSSGRASRRLASVKSRGVFASFRAS